MIVERQCKNRTAKPYPKLMVDTKLDIVVLFLQEEEGVVLDAFGSDFHFGEHDCDWDMEDMVDYEEKITLSNS